MSDRKLYRIFPLLSIVASDLRDASGSPRVSRTPYLPQATVPISYGQVQQPDRSFTEWPSGGWMKQSYDIEDADLFVLKDVIVHGEQGIITIDDMLVAESLYMVSDAHAGLEKVESAVVSLPFRQPDLEVKRAGYSMCGYVANRNYAHWLVNVLSAVQVSPFGAAFDDLVTLMPKLRAGWQRSTLDFVPEAARQAVFIEEKTTVHCAELHYIPQISRADLEPHPARRKTLEILRRRAGVEDRPRRRIYVSRKDAAARKMLNEDEVVTMLEHHGFEAVILTGQSFPEQVRLFAGASHVIGAHGAGLGNILFCQEGARLLELHMDSSLIWSIRRLAALTGMRYGCLLGDVVQSSDRVDDRQWTVSLDDLREALTGFLAEDEVPAPVLA